LGVEVAGGGPGGDHLAALLTDLAEGDQVAGGRRLACLFLELAQGDGLRVLVVAVLALGDGPGAGVPVGPHRPARMSQHHLTGALVAPVEQDPRTAPWHGRAPKVGPEPADMVASAY